MAERVLIRPGGRSERIQKAVHAAVNALKAENPDKEITIAQIAKDFGVHEMTLHKWIRQADIDDGNRPGRTREESTELREARKQIRLLEQENEVLRRAAAYLSQANLPGKGSTRS